MERLNNILSNYPQNDINPKQARYQLLEINVKDFNEKEGNMGGYNCPICKNKGYICEIEKDEYYKDEFHEKYIECECAEIRANLKQAENSGLGEYLHKTFDDFKSNEQWQKNIKEKAAQYVVGENPAWFVALGQSGAGKTLICAIISNEILTKQNKPVVYITWTDFIGKVKREQMSDGAEKVSAMLDKVKNAEVLFIDELLKKYNETDIKYYVEIINYRYTKNLKTIITSERGLNELIGIDEATAGRIYEKTNGYFVNISKDIKKNQRFKGVI